MKMLKRMRVRLATYFVCLALILHLLGSATSIVLLSSILSNAMDTMLLELLAEIRPSVQIVGDHPSLVSWADRAKQQEFPILATIQLYDSKRNLEEEYGPTGIPILKSGQLEDHGKGENRVVRSTFEPVVKEGKTIGFVQVQASAATNDHALEQALKSALLVMPLLVACVAAAGYWFAGVALRPVEETMRLLRRFVADAGHELNTPIAIIEASLETLHEVLKEHDQDNLVDIIGKSASRMSELSSDLVFLARVEDPISAYPMTPVDVSKLVIEVAKDFEPLAKNKQIELKVLQQAELEIIGNAEFLKRMLGNLLSNGLRYTDSGGQLSIATEQRSGLLDIHVSDTGIGIPPESVDHVFDRFYRVDKARARAAGGAGLGLSIVKAVVDAHGGEVKVTSEIGKGSKFTVSLPLGRR